MTPVSQQQVLASRERMARRRLAATLCKYASSPSPLETLITQPYLCV